MKAKIINLAPSSACYSELDEYGTKYRISGLYRLCGNYHFTLHKYMCDGVIHEELGERHFESNCAPEDVIENYLISEGFINV